MHKTVRACRICGNKKLLSVLNLGTQVLTGVFPAHQKDRVPSAPLELVKCAEDREGRHCGLLQLRHSPNLSSMYGDNYGYRSGLNPSMVAHLKRIVEKIMKTVRLNDGELVVDIGSNDGTLLASYPTEKAIFVGIDPVGKKFRKYYRPNIRLIPSFFSSRLIEKSFPKKKAKIVTSVAMFYDLEQPLSFVREIKSILAEDGIWLFEQSYMPTMLDVNAYDTICHEHLEYYRLKQIMWMFEKVGLKVIDVELNDANGGSFAVMASHQDSSYPEATEKIAYLTNMEKKKKLESPAPYKEFKKRVQAHRKELKALIKKLNKEGKKIAGWGASTKGNVMLQYCGITPNVLPCVGEINKDKYGSFTPGTLIPIRSEEEVKATGAEFLLVLPWHFKDHFLKKEREFRKRGGKLIFPLPRVHIV